MTNTARLRLGTRASALARWQSEWVAERLCALGSEVELVHITTGGDVKQGPIGELGEQGLFTKEIQRALLDNRIDLAVHSLKDLPTDKVDRLTLAAVPPREQVNDVLVSNSAESVDTLPLGARIGTGSLRRRSQLLHHRSDLQMKEIRGNLDTRLRKLDEGQFDAIILAAAGLIRLGLQDRIKQVISPWDMLPAVGQGALGIETRSEDEQSCSIVGQLNDPITYGAVIAERTMLATLRGGCLAPVGAWGRVEGDNLKLTGVVLSEDGSERLTSSREGELKNAASIGEDVAEELLQLGAHKLIAASRQSN